MPKFRVAYSSDYLDQQGRPVYEDVGQDLLDAAADRLEYEYLQDHGPVITAEQIQGYDGLILLTLRVDASTFARGAERLLAVARHGVGYDTVDLAACTANDVALITTPPASRHPMAAAALAYMLALGKRLVWKDRLVRENRWQDRGNILGDELQRKTLGIIGLGNIGQELVRLVSPFEMRVIASDPYVSPETACALDVELLPLPEVLAQADFVSVHCALTPETRGLIDAAALSRMKPSAYFVNLSRGPVVDQRALYETLAAGRIAAAAIDVFEDEPCSPDEPLLKLDNVMLAPHSAGITRDFNRHMGVIDCQAMLALSRGEPPEHVVNREVLDRPGFQAKLARWRSAWRPATSSAPAPGS